MMSTPGPPLPCDHIPSNHTSIRVALDSAALPPDLHHAQAHPELISRSLYKGLGASLSFLESNRQARAALPTYYRGPSKFVVLLLFRDSHSCLSAVGWLIGCQFNVNQRNSTVAIMYDRSSRRPVVDRALVISESACDGRSLDGQFIRSTYV